MTDWCRQDTRGAELVTQTLIRGDDAPRDRDLSSAPVSMALRTAPATPAVPGGCRGCCPAGAGEHSETRGAGLLGGVRHREGAACGAGRPLHTPAAMGTTGPQPPRTAHVSSLSAKLGLVMGVRRPPGPWVRAHLGTGLSRENCAKAVMGRRGRGR